MRPSLTIFALATLCFGQNAFAQAAPKEVIVVDGQISVNNLPPSQTVNGEVAVTNLPALQTVEGTVAVSNDGSNPIPVTIQNNAQTLVEYRYVGVTSRIDDGEWTFGTLVGYPAMNSACKSDFGIGARLATFNEALGVYSTDLPPLSAWVGPAGPLFVAQQADGTFRAIDATTGMGVGGIAADEFTAARLAYCEGFTGIVTPTGFNNVALAVGPDPIIARACFVARPAACSAPVALSVTN